MLRLVRRVLTVLLVLVVVLAGAVIWITSGKIHAAAFEVKPAEPSYDVAVVAVEPDRIVLDDRADNAEVTDRIRALRRGWTYGLRWKGGSGLVQGPASVGDGHEVTLSFRLLEGGAPEPGTRVDAFRDLYADPAAVAADTTEGEPLQLREVTYGEHDLPAYVAQRDEARWAVLVHGKGGTPLEMVRMARDLAAAGRTVMLIGYRNDKGAWQDPSGAYGYGTTEWRDLHAALVWAHDQGARDVVLGGASMGGGIVASYLEHVPDHHGVSGAVLDSPMLDLDTVVSWGAREEKLPGGLPLPSAVVWAAERTAGLRFGLDWKALDYVDGRHGTGWADVPVLVLHGDDDGTVPVTLSRELADADGDVRLEEFPAAGHVEAWNSDPARYDRLVTGFAD
jgi:pimeloyl-ACP methyl ester carboxylesterase